MKTENRIQINGTWYVKEEEPCQTEPQDLLYTQQCLLELDQCVFEASRMYTDYNNEIFFKDSVDIKYTNKITKESDYWDNSEWMRELFEGEKEALDEISDILNKSEIAQLKVFIGTLIENEWLNY
jgi:hypothetical protein